MKYTQEQVREALMRLSMCACNECEICKYKDRPKAMLPSDECKERSKKNMNILADTCLRDDYDLNRTREKAILGMQKAFSEQCLENERLKKEIESLENSVRLQAEMLYEARVEAIKAFSERLHKGIDDFRDRREMVMLPYTESALLIIERKIDNLVAEMTEGEEI